LITMQTKYNKVVDDSFAKAYLEKLVDKIFKLLPLREEKNENLHKYHESIMVELVGFADLFVEIKNKSEFVSMMASLEGLMKIEDMSLYRRKVFECINLCKKVMLGVK
jgi:CTP:phosphocholine cytidylyltransferase-like protein